MALGAVATAGATATSDNGEDAVSVGNAPVTEGTGNEAAGGAAAAEMLPSERILQMEEEEKREIEELKQKRDPPIVFRDSGIDVAAELDNLRSLLQQAQSPSDESEQHQLQSIDELRQYLLENEGSWALGDNFLNFVGHIFHDKSSVDTAARVSLLKILGVAALKDDVILLLHQDRREHIVMNYAYDIDRHPYEEQLPLAQFVSCAV